MDIAIPWSKPNQKSKAWWNQDISSLKSELAMATRIACRELRNQVYKAQQKEASRGWRRAIRHAQWKFWETTFQNVSRSSAFSAIRGADKKKAVLLLPGIQGISSVQGKCQIL